ncbi:hypothetical protein CORC01_01556 [Colletotrichum orchidophilum]|uniref:Heterokaryon incompatibility domain-containing protein n=1 Tax=Colletotrichum orchidophilum TaxID=1209926 RepID=A0A1G4BNY9_9PEZI|nr:uncharacterized protein CORC01_01556 [Colletotrichum orchidophilum]OHF03172.1 hypothetical protein CORC01_01556 [Colletotrichum orchidophilum]
MSSHERFASPELISEPGSLSNGATLPNNIDTMVNGPARRLPNGTTTPQKRARGFETVDPTPPTSAKRHQTGILDGPHTRKDPLTKGQVLQRAANLYDKQYVYKDCPICQGEIRLLLLQPSENRFADIVVELRSFSIQEIMDNPDEFKFTALSYNWGREEESKIVLIDTCNDKDLVPVPSMNEFAEVVTHFNRKLKRLSVKPNLYAFLQEFRQQHKPVALWVDRICINQEDNKEKQDQVAIMGQIYSTAANVAIWLGPADEDGKTDRAMDFISFVLQDETGEKFKAKYATNWSELLYLMRRRWFSRRWIIQELALAKSAEVRCGSKKRNWRDFSDAVSIFALQFDSILREIKRDQKLERSLEGIKDMKPLGARILVDVLSNTFQRQVDGDIYAPRQGLESLISSLSTFETSDPRDTIYTLLNLAKETCTLPSSNSMRKRRLSKQEKNLPPEPDYSLDLLQVYTNFVKWCIEESDSLDILCRHWALPELKQKLDEHYPRLVELPSWIKTVQESAYGSQNEGFGGRRTGDSFVGVPGARCYNASNGLSPKICFGRDMKLPKPIEDISAQKAVEGNEQFEFITSSQQRPLAGQMNRNLLTRRRNSDNSLTLIVRGLCIGIVSESYPMHEGIIPRQVLRSLGHDQKTELQSVSETVWRTLVADRDADGKAPPAWYHRACMTCLVSDTNAGNIDTNAILQQDEAATNLKADYMKRVQAVCWNRRYIECKDENGADRKLVGIAPQDSKVDDFVCILFGCSVPCILRPFWNDRGRGSDPAYYELVGEAFLLGQMDGEALDGLSEEELAGVEFRLM